MYISLCHFWCSKLTSPLRRPLRGRPPGGSGTWPPWWRWTSRPSPANNQPARSVSPAHVRLQRKLSHCVYWQCVPLVPGREAKRLFLTLSTAAHTLMCSPDAAVLSISPSDSDAERTQWTHSGSGTNRPAEGALYRWVGGWVGGVLFCSLNGN